MKFAKLFNYTGAEEAKPDDYLKALNRDLTNITNMFNGRIRLGTGVDGARGENIAGEFQVFTSATSAGDTVVSHTLKTTPIGFLIINKGGTGDIYMASSTSANATFVSTTTSTSYSVFLLK